MASLYGLVLVRRDHWRPPSGVGRSCVASPSANFGFNLSRWRRASASFKCNRDHALNGFAAGDEAPPTLRRMALMASTPAPHGVSRPMSALKRGRSNGHP